MIKPVTSRIGPLWAAGLLLAACSRADAPAASSPGADPPPPEVVVVTARSGTVPVIRERVGRLAATRIAEVRARVAGIILQRRYQEGSDVEAGTVLFEIDPAPLRADLHAAEATLARARADASNAAQTAKRYRDLAAQKLLSTQDLDGALAEERTTAAAVREAEAKVERAQLDLGYATVTSPITGRAGRALVTEGALVGEDEATELTRIEQIDPVYVNFGLPVADLQPALDAMQAVGTDATVELVLQDGTPYPLPGQIDFADSAVDPGTGTASLRARVANPERRLLPGMFVGLRVVVDRVANAYLLPQASVARDATGAYLMVVGDDGKVEQRRVTTHGMTRREWIVSGAVHDGDQVIVEGLQKVQAGGSATAAPASGD